MKATLPLLVLILSGCGQSTRETSSSIFHEPGLWQISFRKDESSQRIVSKVCINSKDGIILHLIGQDVAKKNCSKIIVTNNNNGYEALRSCLMPNGEPYESRFSVLAGPDNSFSQITTEVMQSGESKKVMNSKINAKRIGPCGFVLRSGDSIFTDGGKINLHAIYQED